MLPAREYSFADYLRIEESSETKHEYFFGQIVSMAGGSPRHALLAVNVAAELRRRLTGTSCQVYLSDLRLAISPRGMAVYPDVTVICGSPRPIAEDRHTFDNPAFVAEILSPSTRLFDTGAKAAAYRRVESMREFLLIEARAVEVEHWTRSTPDRWTVERIVDPQACLQLAGLRIELPLAEIYRDAEGLDE